MVSANIRVNNINQKILKKLHFKIVMESKMVIFLACCLTLLVSYVQTTSFDNCGSAFKITNLEVEGCDSDGTCILPINTNVTIKLAYINDLAELYPPLTNSVALYIGGGRFELDVTPTNPCEVLHCPFPQNHVTTYTTTVSIPDFPPVLGKFKWNLVDKKHDLDLACFEFLAIVV